MSGSVAVADVLVADVAGLNGAAGIAAAAGSAVDATAQRVTAIHPGADVWEGEASTAFAEAITSQGTRIGHAGHGCGIASSAIRDYARIVDQAASVAEQGERMRSAGEFRVRWGVALYRWAAVVGNSAAAVQAISTRGDGIAERDAGVALGEHAATAVARAADRAIARLCAAIRMIEEGTAAEEPERVWTWSDFYLAPVTLLAGAFDGVVVQSVKGLAQLSAAQLAAEWHLVSDPEGRERLARWGSFGPTGLLMAAGGEDLLRASVGEAWTQYQQLQAAGREGRYREELANDLAAGASATGAVLGEITDVNRIREGLSEGDLFTVASGAGSIADFVFGSHGLGTLGDVGRVADAARVADGANLVGDLGRLDGLDGGFDLPISSAVDHALAEFGSRIPSGEPVTSLLGRLDDGGWTPSDELWVPADPPGTARTATGTLVPEGYLEELTGDNPWLDVIRGRGRDPDQLARPERYDGFEAPLNSVVKIYTDAGHGSGFVIGVDEAAGRTTIATARHVVYQGLPLQDKALIIPSTITGVEFPIAGWRQHRLWNGRGQADPFRTAVLPDSYTELPPSQHLRLSDSTPGDVAVVHLSTTPPPGTFVVPLALPGGRLTPGDRVITAGYPANWQQLVQTQPRYSRERGLITDGGYHVPYTPDLDRNAPGVDFFSPYISQGMSGGPVLRVSDDGAVELVGVNSFHPRGSNIPGRMPPETPLAWQQSYRQIIDPAYGFPGTRRIPARGGYGNILGSARITPELRAWLEQQARYGM